MLKLVGTLRNGSSILGSRSTSWGISNHQISACSTAVASQTTVDKHSVTTTENSSKSGSKSKHGMVQLVFDHLKEKKKPVENLITPDKIDALFTANQNITHERAALTVSTLSQWVEQGKISFSDFENDPRYQRLCRILARKTAIDHLAKKQNTSTVIYGLDDINESYENVNKLNLPQTVKVMSTLSLKQKRVTPLLRHLADNINRSKSPLSIKQTADVLYSMATLNFPDENLLRKLCDDLKKSLSLVKQSAVIGSIMTSLGMLRYRNSSLMNDLSKWAVENKKIMRTQDVCALLMTMATIGYHPENILDFLEVLVKPLKQTDMVKSSEWLDVIWALTVLNQASTEQVASVLNKNFVEKLADPEVVPLVKKIKLLNINAAAKLVMENYSHSLLENNSLVLDTPIIKSKDKQVFVKSIIDALVNLFPTRDHFAVNVDSDTGFLLDAEFLIDKKTGSVLPMNTNNLTNAHKIAIVANSYHDFCLGEPNLLGSVLLHYRLLAAQGYKILDISYADFHTDDKLLSRITYMNERIKSIVK